MAELKVLFQDEKDQLDKLKEIIAKQEKEADPLMRWCTKPGCSGSMRADDLEAVRVSCPICATQVCFQCRDEWHSGTCEDNMKTKLEGWVSQHGGVRFCPVCKTKVEKNEGCNHMTCIICKYEFCWLCLGYAAQNANHWNPMSPYSCGAPMIGAAS